MSFSIEEALNKISTLESKLSSTHSELDVKDQEIERLNDLLVKFKRMLFVSKSEAAEDSSQYRLFDEVETEEPSTEVKKQIKSYTRGKPKRKPIPDDLPREDTVIDIPESEKVCSHGIARKKIGEVVSEKLAIQPQQVKVLRTIRYKYACSCKKCEKNILLMDLPPSAIPKSMASSSLLAYIAVSKYADSLPLYRQEKMFERVGVELNRSTMASWMIRISELIQPLYNLMLDEINESNYIAMDETRVQVLKEDGRPAQSKSFMWVIARAGPEPLILFNYDRTRSGEVPLKLIDGFKGYLQADGYSGYNKICSKKDITRVGCMAHCRRKFNDASKGKKKGIGKRGFGFIENLYKIEKEIKNCSPEEKLKVRQERSKPILEKMKVWIDEQLPKTTPKSLSGIALQYANNHWVALTKYIENPILRIDNNLVENAIRPFALGRKNWLFSDTEKGAHASSVLYSIIETAKANSLNPFKYMMHILDELPKAKVLSDYEKLLPANVKL